MNRLLVCWQSAWAWWGLAGWFILVSGAAWADDRITDPAFDGQASELRIKAAYLCKFGAFVEWPDHTFPAADAPVVIGVLGADALADELSTVIRGRSLQGRRIAVRRLRAGDGLAGLHVLFIGLHAPVGAEADLLAAARGMHVLTVTDAPPSEGARGIINFVSDNGRVRFDVCLKAAQEARLVISARLLAVARHVMPSVP